MKSAITKYEPAPVWLLAVVMGAGLTGLLTAILIRKLADRSAAGGTLAGGGLDDDDGAAAELGIKLIKKWEAFSANAYPDPGDPTNGPVTIGYGTTVKPDGTRPELGETIDEPTAEAYLRDHVDRELVPALRLVPRWVDLNAHQRAALMSFGYNLGSHFYGAPRFSKLTAALDGRGWLEAVPDALELYVYAGGKKWQGLVNRRADEIRMWATAD